MGSDTDMEFQGMQQAFADDVKNFTTYVANLATERVCGSTEPREVVRNVVEKVVVRDNSALVGAGLVGLATGAILGDAANMPAVQGFVTDMRGKVGGACNGFVTGVRGKVGGACNGFLDGTYSVLSGVARKVRGNRGKRGKRARFAPYGQRDHEEMQDAEQQPVPVEDVYGLEEGCAMCAQAIGCHASTWEHYFTRSFKVLSTKWAPLNEQEALQVCLQFDLPVNENMYKHWLVSCIITIELLLHDSQIQREDLPELQCKLQAAQEMAKNAK